MERIISIVSGVVIFGWLQFVYRYLFDLLYWSFATKSKIEACRAIVDTGMCKLIGYVSLWLMEVPLIIFTMVTSIIVLFIIYKSKIAFKPQLVFCGIGLSGKLCYIHLYQCIWFKSTTI